MPRVQFQMVYDALIQVGACASGHAAVSVFDGATAPTQPGFVITPHAAGGLRVEHEPASDDMLGHLKAYYQALRLRTSYRVALMIDVPVPWIKVEDGQRSCPRFRIWRPDLLARVRPLP
jgi:hypothetical protein